MTPELADLSRSIDPVLLGRRIRNARVAAGMTQAQVAGDDVTTAYISRIEDGQRRPEAKLLDRMATRMNSSLEELLLGVSRNRALELQVALDQAQLQFASGNVQEALTAVDELLPEVEGTGPLESAARELRAYALEATGDLDGAILALEKLAASPAPDARWLKVLIALSRCYRDSGDYSRSIAVGEQAANTIDELGIQGLTEAIQLTVTVAGAYLLRGELNHAMRMCKKAIEDAEKYDSMTARASAYWNASVIESRRGATESALEMGRKALLVFEASEDARNLARLRSEFANLQLKSDPPDAAGALATLAQAELEAAWSPTSAHDQARTLLSRGRAHFLLGEYAEALQYADASADAAPEASPMGRASAIALRGQIRLASGDHAGGLSSIRDAVLVLSSVGADREAAQLWFELGTMLSEAGDTEGALDAFRRAGASTGLNASTPSHAQQVSHVQR